MPHPLIDQFRFTRREWLRGLAGLSEDDAQCHFGPMNCISWTVGHLAWIEQRFWLERAQNKVLFPQLKTDYAYGAPASTPSLRQMNEIWLQVTQAADPYLDQLTTQSLQSELLIEGQAVGQSVGSALRRITYHYWYHIGETQAIRQMLEQVNLPEYVGDIEREAPYCPE